MYKISIIIPIFNVEKYLERALNSIINQTMDFRDIEVIMVDDCSTDNSKKIIEEYSNKYSNFIGIYHEKNSGCAAIPRNTGLKAASGDYIMFLDPDDEFFLNACETLYNNIEKYDADVVFGRYIKKYEHNCFVEKSYSPYDDNLIDIYSSLKFHVNYESKFVKLVKYIFCGKQYAFSKNMGEIIHVDNINEEPVLLTVATSVWTKIYKKKLILDNNIYFPSFRLGEDLAFGIQTFLNAKNIVFLNNFIVCKYSTSDSNENQSIAKENQSITKNINFKLLDDGIDNLIFCSNHVKEFSNKISLFTINPHLLNWFILWRQSNLTDNENKELIDKLYELKKGFYNLRTKLLLVSIIYFIKLSIVRH